MRDKSISFNTYRGQRLAGIDKMLTCLSLFKTPNAVGLARSEGDYFTPADSLPYCSLMRLPGL
jgi:hypothetical protein